MELETELDQKFHDLPGLTVEEKKKSFNLFITELNEKISNESIKNTFVMNLKPNNKLEEVLKVDLLLHYQIYDAVLELLKSGNVLYISMVLKDWNFFKATFPSMHGGTFVNDILPHTSFSARMKIINRVSKNLCSEDKAEEFFQAIEEKYGISSAEVMLPYCSVEMIKRKVQQYNLVLAHRQLMIIWKRSNEFFEFYFGYLRNKHHMNNFAKEFKILKVIFLNNEELFWKLHEQYFFNICFGKRLTKKVLRDKEHLLKEVDSYHIRFQKRQVYKQLRKNPKIFKEFVLQRTTESMLEFHNHYNYSFWSGVGQFIYPFISESRRYKFLNDFFKEKFSCNLHDKPKIVTAEILLLMPQELRESVLKATMEEDDTLAYLLRPEIAVPYLMDKIKHCSEIHKRVSYLSMLYKTCEFHKDEGYLLKILEYVEKRHRNDIIALEGFFRNLESWENIENLSADHWIYIDRIEKLLQLKDIRISCDYLLEKRIAYRLNNNLDISELMKDCFELFRNDNAIFWNIPKYRRTCILEIKKYIEKVENKEELDRLLAKYLLWILNHNQSTLLEDHIPILDHLPLLRRLLKTPYFPKLAEIVNYYLPQHYEEFNPIVWEHRHSFLEEWSLLRWYILNRKDELLNKVEFIVDLPCIQKNKKFVLYLSLHSFRAIPERMTDLCVEAIQTNESIPRKNTALNILSLLSQDYFLRISESSNPNADGKINVDDPPEKIKLQESILKNLKHWNTPADLLHVILKFCVGDYLKYALQPLYSIMNHVPEKQAVLFLKKLHKSAVSVRKHTIHLSKFICPFDEFCKFILEESVVEKNASIKTILFKKALEYASRMPTERTWELIKATMHGIDKEDVEASYLLLRIEGVPVEYRAAYIPEAYALLKSNKLTQIQRNRFDLINNISPEIIHQLECDLLQTFLTDVLFNEDAGSAIDNWINFIFHSTGEKQNVLYDFALNKLEEYNRAHPSDHIDYKQSNFMRDICRGFLAFSSRYSMVEKFGKVWFSKCSPEINIDHHYNVVFTLAYAECEYNIKKFATKIIELLFKYFPDGGSEYVFDFFVISLREFLGRISNADSCDIVETLLATDPCVFAYLISIRILPLREPRNKIEFVRCSSIIEKLQERPELYIKIHFRKHLQEFQRRVNEKLAVH